MSIKQITIDLEKVSNKENLFSELNNIFSFYPKSEKRSNVWDALEDNLRNIIYGENLPAGFNREVEEIILNVKHAKNLKENDPYAYEMFEDILKEIEKESLLQKQYRLYKISYQTSL